MTDKHMPGCAANLCSHCHRHAPHVDHIDDVSSHFHHFAPGPCDCELGRLQVRVAELEGAIRDAPCPHCVTEWSNDSDLASTRHDMCYAGMGTCWKCKVLEEK